jgi:hypothetical protein
VSQIAKKIGLKATQESLSDPLIKTYLDLINEGNTGEEYAELTRSQIKKLKSQKREADTIRSMSGTRSLLDNFQRSESLFERNEPLRLKVIDTDRSASQ